MALRALMLNKDIADLKAKLGELENRDADLQSREAELEASIAEVSTDEERSAVNTAIDTFEADKKANEEQKENLRSQISALEDELKALENQQPAPIVEEQEEKREDIVMTDMEIQERSAFSNYVRGLETRDDYNMTQGNNGVVVPKSIAQEIIVKVKEICPIFEKATRYNIKGTLEVPYYPYSTDHIVSCAYSTEMSELTASSGDFGAVEMTGFVAGALAKISKKLINNTDVDVVPFIVDQMAEAFKTFYEQELINGTNGKVTGLLAGIDSDATITASKLSSITADELIEVQAKVPTAYQGNACWIMAPATFLKLRKLKDGENRYLLNPDMRNEFGYTLLGKPVYLSDNMPALGTANNKAVVYGDLSGLGVKTAEDLEIQVLNERFATAHAVGVIGWTEFDAKVVNAQKFGCIKCGSAD